MRGEGSGAGLDELWRSSGRANFSLSRPDGAR